MKIFTSIKSKAEGQGAIFDNYSKKSLKNVLVIRDEVCGKFKIFDSIKKFEKCLYLTKECERCFHEIIFGFVPQKLKFDIDALGVDLIFAKKMIKHIVKCIKDIFYQNYSTYEKKLKNRNIIITDSSGLTEKGYKYSFHIILNGFYVQNNEESKYFTELVFYMVKDQYRKYIDLNVNSYIQNLRLPECCKYGESRFKKIINKTSVISDAIITYTRTCEELPNILKQESQPSLFKEKALAVLVNDDVVKRAIDMADEFLDGHDFRSISGNVLSFNRTRATLCQICERIHDKDNTAILIISENSGLYFKCRHNSKGSIYVGKMMTSEGTPNKKDSDVHKKGMCGYIDLIKSLPTEPQKFDNLPMRNIYCSETLKEFELSKTLYVQAQMKMGKTKSLIKFCEKYFLNKSVIIVSFRQTFSNSVKSRFGNFELYNKIKGDIDLDIHKKIIIQVESLHRLIIPNESSVDLLIFDEAESIFEQLGSGLLANFSESFAVFRWLVKYSEHLVSMDANLGDRTFNIINKIRHKSLSPEKNKECFFHCNTYSTASDDKYVVTFSLTQWLEKLTELLDNNEKIAIPINSITEAEVIYEFIKKKYTNKAVGFYSSKTPVADKQLHFGDVDKYWSKYDVLIFTPTVSAGVSFEKKHFTSIMGYFVSSSCGVEVVRQMIGRIRNVETHKFIILLPTMRNKLPTKTEYILNTITDRRNNLYRKLKDKYLTMKFNKDGKIQIKKTDYLAVYLENSRIANLSINDFAGRFIAQIHKSGGEISSIDNVKQNTEGLFGFHKKLKEEIKIKKNRDIAGAKDLSLEEIDRIEQQVTNQEELSESDRLSLEKFKLKSFYGYEGPVDDNFVDIYGSTKTKKIYSNLTMIKNFTGSAKKTLNDIQSHEKNCYEFNKAENSVNSQFRDLNKFYLFDRHRLAIGILNLCGVEDVNKSTGKNMSKDTLVEKFIDAKLPRKLIEREFACFIPSKDRICWGNIKPHVNKILSMYGLYFRNVSKKISVLGLISLEKRDLFGGTNQPQLHI
jgi:hypothetical protein